MIGSKPTLGVVCSDRHHIGMYIHGIGADVIHIVMYINLRKLQVYLHFIYKSQENSPR
jgi:hypothetical protein